jgi:hypothetical protein
MKNKILKFIELLKEAHEDDELDLKDITLDLSDELIEFEIHKGYFSKQALDKGQVGEKVLNILHNTPIYEDDKYCFCIQIQLNQLKDTLKLGDRFGKRRLIKDKKIFIIFRELYQISERYDNCFIHINDGSGSLAYPSIYLFILLETEVDKSVTKIMQVFKEIKSRNSSAKSDFSNDTTVKLKDDKIIISSSKYNYTDRKFRGLIKDIDLSDFNIEKTEEDTGSITKDVVLNTISKKI